MPSVFCVDIGNTSLHAGLVVDGECRDILRFRPNEMGRLVGACLNSQAPVLAYCSVVPERTTLLADILQVVRGPQERFQLTHETYPLGFDFPRPEQIGPDRLANSVAAHHLYGTPSVVLDMGTSVNIEVVTDKGFSGGIIAPGLVMVCNALHEHTALLPQVDPRPPIGPEPWGKSTLLAMHLGARVGFQGMIDALLHRVLAPLEGQNPTLVATGGNLDQLPAYWQQRARVNPALALQGLYWAWKAQAGV